MPVKLSRKGASVLNRNTGKVEKKFKSRAAARAYASAVNMAHARKRGYSVPKPLNRRRSRGRG